MGRGFGKNTAMMAYVRASHLPKIDIVRNGTKIEEVMIDGFTIRGVRSLSTRHAVGDVPVITLEILAEDIVMRDTIPGGHAPVASRAGDHVEESYHVPEGAYLIGSE